MRKEKKGLEEKRGWTHRVLLPLFCGLVALLSGCQSQNTSNTSSASSAEIASQLACAADASSECSPGEEKSTAASDGENTFQDMTFEEAITFFEEGKSGLLYFGFPDCPWCQEVLPLLNEAAGDKVTVYSIRTRDDNRQRLYTDEQKERIAPYIGDFFKENKDGEPTLYVPLVVAVENGTVAGGHQGTVDDHDAHERKMNAQEQEEVEKDLNTLVEKAAAFVAVSQADNQ